jgi:uncharacterized protein
MNRLVLAVALLLSLPFAARADDASHRAKAEELIALLHSDQVATQLINEVLRQTTEITTKRSAGKMTPETQAALADFQKKVVSVLEPQIGWKAIEPGYVQLYTDTFSEEDLDHMIAFYKSPSGALLLEKLPAINQQISHVLQTKMAALQPQMNQMLNDFENSVTPKAPPTPPPTLNGPPAAPAPTSAPGKSTTQ